VAYGPISEFLADDGLDVAHGRPFLGIVAARRRPQPHGLSAGWADRKLRRLRTLGDDWDGHGAAAPAREALARAHEFLVTLETWPRHVPRPDVMASTEGGVLVEWDADGVEVIIEFPAQGCVNVYLKTPRAEAEGPVADHLDDLSEALSHVVRLT
jgi:hypothetical protein